MDKILVKLNNMSKHNEIIKIKYQIKNKNEKIYELKNYFKDVSNNYQNKINNLQRNNSELVSIINEYEKSIDKMPKWIKKIFGINKNKAIGEKINE